MPRHSEQRVLPYSVEQIYSLVTDVDQYHQFLPWCVESRVTQREATYFDAILVVGYKMFRENFHSRVHCVENETVSVEYKRGPMKNLTNQWRFEAHEGGCLVHFDVAFEFHNPLLQGLINAFFHEAFGRMVNAFEGRARDLYGPA